MDTAQIDPGTTFVWPSEDVSQIPFRVYTDQDLYDREQQVLFQGLTWNYLCLDCEIPEPGDYKMTYIGDAPIVVVRDENGDINAMVNRCAHKGSLVCYKPRGNIKEFACIYWGVCLS